MDTKRFIIFLILGLVCLLVFVVVYKFIRWELNKSSEAAKEIMNKYETEEEREKALKMLRRKNMRKAGFVYLIFMIGLPLIAFFVLLMIRIFMG